VKKSKVVVVVGIKDESEKYQRELNKIYEDEKEKAIILVNMVNCALILFFLFIADQFASRVIIGHGVKVQRQIVSAMEGPATQILFSDKFLDE